MVSFKALLLFSVLSSTSVFARDEPTSSSSVCIDDATAASLVDTFNYFYVNIDSSLALETLTEDFEEWSDSDNNS